ncbi:hypothetical protein Pyn_39377 [Prunus yedoensis var. nudiflora]|uniref:Uncharacterized protein n=1 Tax=Prunus yedoensis var. nudiflora TaxID=2094558 RepID=A0A314XYW7_PRUYE|nr:hypothetical protein Pyn_39377 [Prunus yedoensis var. nudiflora]
MSSATGRQTILKLKFDSAQKRPVAMSPTTGRQTFLKKFDSAQKRPVARNPATGRSPARNTISLLI